VQVIPLALKEGMFLDMQNNVKVASRSTEVSSLPKSSVANARAVFHSRGNFCLDRALAQYSALAFALRARIGNYTATALARGTSPRDTEKSLLVTNLPAAVARATRYGRFSRSRTGSTALLARLMSPDGHGTFRSEHGFFKLQAQVFAKIGAPLSTAAAAASLRSAEHISKSEKVSEDFAEVLNNARIESSSRGPHAGMPEAVVASALLLVDQNGVCLSALFEPILRIRVIGIAVRMVLHRQLAISALDLDLGRAPANTQHLVVIAFFVSGQNNLSSFLNC